MNRLTKHRSWAFAIVVAPLLASACAAEDAGIQPGSSGSTAPTTVGGAGGGGTGGEGQGGQSGEGDVLVGPCTLGSTHACVVHHAGGCATGLQYCVNGAWSDCERAVSRSGTTHRSFDDPSVTCGLPGSGTTANTCDPECQAIAPDGLPDFGGGTSGGADWVTGDLGDLPADIIEDGLEEPCNNASDCMFDHYCDFTTETCEPWAPGEALTACTQGPASRPDISLGVPCEDSIPLCNRGPVTLTAAQMAAISIRYDSSASMESCNIGGGEGTCPITAPQDLAPGDCITVECALPEDVYVFADFAANQECDCANNWTYNSDGACGAPSCGGTVSTASEVPLTLFVAVDRSLSMEGSRWNAIRPGLVSFFGDAASDGLGVALKLWPNDRCASSACDADAAYVSQGTCTKHPCDFWVTGPAPSSTLSPACHPTVADMCDEPAWDQCCNLGSSGTKRWNALCAEEFSRRSGYACGIKHTCNLDPCESFSGSAIGAAVTLSPSCHPTVAEMCSEPAWDQCCNTGSSGTRRWTTACATEFASRTGGSDGLCKHKTCDHADIPGVADGIDGYRLELTAAAAPTDVAEKQLVGAVNSVVDFPAQTPFTPVLRGGVDFCRSYQELHPDERCIVVMATDADIGPSGPGLVCGTSLSTALAAADDGVDDGILTYVIGVEGSTETYLDQLATAGGTGQAFILGGGAGAGADLIAAFETIRNAFACSYGVAEGTEPAAITMVWNNGGASDVIAPVADVTACGGAPSGRGYYWSGTDELTLCPTTCESVKSAPSSNVEIEIACGASAEPAEVIEEFTARGACPESGTYAQWTLLLYTADVPTGSSIVVDAQTRFDAGSAWSGWTNVETITEANEVSDLTAPTSLLDALGLAALAEDIQIRFATTVGGGAPSLLGYEVQFTCVDTE